MLLVELVGSVQVLLVEEQRVFAGEYAWPRRAPDRVSDRVSHDGSNRAESAQVVDVEKPLGTEEAGRHEQRITREKEPDQQTGLGEDDRSDADVAAPLDQRREVGELMEEIDEGCDEGFHEVDGRSE